MKYNTFKKILINLLAYIYKNLIKPLLFKVDPEIVHNRIAKLGENLGRYDLTKNIAKPLLRTNFQELNQQILGINFINPIGLAAGFDYEAGLTQILPSVGFGFETVGTITYSSYEGNPRPILGRLPKSQSLMVNKGFKNLGAIKTREKLENLSFNIPVGISIGRTNSLNIEAQKDSIEDIIKTFVLFESSKVMHSYYELNISCPNLHGNISFYPPRSLDELLLEVDKLNISRPIFIKMPIEKTNDEVLQMLEVISNHSPKGVIFGNLQKDRSNPALVQDEVNKFNVGNFSGKPTFERSNELIQLSYKYYHDKLLIIGCGGVFSAEDAYTKIKLGASLIQLITGMIFEGPQLIAQINYGLKELLERDGFTHISQAIGVDGKF